MPLFAPTSTLRRLRGGVARFNLDDIRKRYRGTVTQPAYGKIKSRKTTRQHNEIDFFISCETVPQER